MRRAMAEAEVGDDVYGEDPTVLRLEAEAAEMLGHEAALFMPTGTMGNQVALHLHTRRPGAGAGSEVICEARSHVLLYEMGAMAALSGLLPRPVAGDPSGRLDPEAVEGAIAPDVGYLAPTGAVVVENTHNMAGGTVTRPEALAALVEVARRHELPIHLDGARIFNAAVALGLPAAELARGFDSVMFSLSKGLGAPVGSMLCGGRSFIAAARRVRKMFGGGMRQVGVLAAAGRMALSQGPPRLAADHANARRLAEGLAGIRGLEIDPATVETNIVIFRVGPEWFGADAPATPALARTFVARAAEAGVLAVPVGPDRVRFVTHRDVASDRIDQALAALAP
ncbi:MAG TPA: GntG family PLP-dependent aldolase [Thermoanaerobaculia bacterium]|nr:GntG family PLP-dependent aldolase [Thermoanaerobaculia bacterium]